MTLVDTSVWVDHFRKGNDELRGLLNRSEVLCHPFIVGELACGFLKNRKEIFGLLSALPRVSLAEHEEVMFFLEKHQLFGAGLGWVDLHLLSSASLSNASLWTIDRSLRRAAERVLKQ